MILVCQTVILVSILIFSLSGFDRTRLISYLVAQLGISVMLAAFGFSWIAIGHLFIVWLFYFLDVFAQLSVNNEDGNEVSNKSSVLKDRAVSVVFITVLAWIVFQFNFQKLPTEHDSSQIYALRNVGIQIIREFFIPTVMIVFVSIGVFLGIGTLLERE